jgi:hypothetical protein
VEVTMRVNVKNALEAWNRRESCRKSRSVWTDGSILYSYNTPILFTREGKTVLNVRKYSSTTSTQQNSLYAYLTVNRIPFIEEGEV